MLLGPDLMPNNAANSACWQRINTTSACEYPLLPQLRAGGQKTLLTAFFGRDPGAEAGGKRDGGGDPKRYNGKQRYRAGNTRAYLHNRISPGSLQDRTAG